MASKRPRQLELSETSTTSSPGKPGTGAKRTVAAVKPAATKPPRAATASKTPSKTSESPKTFGALKATRGRPRKAHAHGAAESIDEPDDNLRAPKPFVKWAGGKRQLLAQILAQFPKQFRTYHEPFVGGGAVFFALKPRRIAYLSDSNDRLVRSYRGIKENVKEVIALLKQYPKSREFFLEMRARDIDSASDVEVAAWFIYLNKLAFNGLYRVNSKNKYNVPYGDNENASICDEKNLRACSRALARATIEHEDFLEVGRRARKGDLVYFDPPYIPLSTTSYFTSYTVGGFTHADQEKLRDLAIKLKRRGVHVLLSNSPPAAKLYTAELGFSVTEVLAARAMNSKAELRGKITELLIR